MKIKSIARLLVGFLLAVSTVIVCAQQPVTGDQQDNPPEQKVIYDLREYNAYINALNTLDPAARIAAFEAFLKEFPESVMQPEAKQYVVDARLQLDNQQVAEQLRKIRAMQAAEAGSPQTPQQRACKTAEGANFSFDEMEFILQYRDSGVACNKEAAERVWRAIRHRQRSAKGDVVGLTLPVQVLSATARSIDAALTDANQNAHRADLRITMETPMGKPPTPGATVEVTGIIAEYTPQPFLFIMTHASLAEPKQSAVRGPGTK
jgi:hypothetical protein